MMKKLILIGGGAYGREIAELLPYFSGFEVDWRFAGFIDNKLDRAGIEDRTIGLISDHRPGQDEVFVCTLPEYTYKRRYTESLEQRGATFISLIHRNAVVAETAHIGVGCIVQGFTTISINVAIGRHVTMNGYNAIGHEALIEEYCHLNAYAFVGGTCHIEAGATLHTHSSILPGKRVGGMATVGAGSVVLRNVKPGTTIYGNPAKILRF